MGTTDVELTKEQLELIMNGSRLARVAADDPLALRERHELAILLVELRGSFTDYKGRPDYRGATGEYRAATARLYELAGLRKADRERVRRAVAHHVSNILHETLTPEQLTDYNLRSSQNERRRQRRERTDD